jgi:deoxyribodipyrimidine photo-lyase
MAAEAGDVLPLFVLDPCLWESAGDVRKAYLLQSLRALDSTINNTLHLVRGDPAMVVRSVAQRSGADRVVMAADYGPYGGARDRRVEKALADAGIELTRVGSPYAVAPGRVTKADGSPYRVYSPFYNAWTKHGWRAPADDRPGIDWLGPPEPITWPSEPKVDAINLPLAGEEAAHRRWHDFLQGAADSYADDRNRPDLDRSSRMSVHLKFGEIHPRTLLADLGDSESHEVFRKELAWREFYADVLHHTPETATDYLRPEFARMDYATPSTNPESLHAWQQGMTGYPIVDAGMRQLLAEGWMHNRVRMVVASFLVKDLHFEWQVGAEWFMQHLVDGDLASNSHGWQWTAGCGTDAAPYFRVFNPVTQGLRFDPDGNYVQRYVPELRHLEGKAAHTPWKAADGHRMGYPPRIVDHANERQVALNRYAAIKD